MSRIECDICNGTGHDTHMSHGILTCDFCGGTGFIDEQPIKATITMSDSASPETVEALSEMIQAAYAMVSQPGYKKNSHLVSVKRLTPDSLEMMLEYGRLIQSGEWNAGNTEIMFSFMEVMKAEIEALWNDAPDRATEDDDE